MARLRRCGWPAVGLATTLGPLATAPACSLLAPSDAELKGSQDAGDDAGAIARDGAGAPKDAVGMSDATGDPACAAICATTPPECASAGCECAARTCDASSSCQSTGTDPIRYWCGDVTCHISATATTCFTDTMSCNCR